MNYKTLAPEGTFIREYLEYMEGVETPQVFDFYTALWILGTCCGPTVYVNRPRFPVYLSSYIVLISSSGQTRRGYNPSLVHSLPNTVLWSYPGRVRKSEALDKGDTGRSYAIQELNTEIGKDVHAKGFLIDLIKRYNDGQTNLLASSTPTKLFSECHPLLMEPDYASKFLFIVSDGRKKRIPWPKEVKDDRLRGTLRDTIQDARSIGGRGLSKVALKRFTNWYNGRPVTRDPTVSGLRANEDTQLLWIAALLSINNRTLDIQGRHIGAASRLKSDIDSSIERLYGGIDLGSRGRIIEGIERARTTCIEAAGDGIRERDLYRSLRSNVTWNEFKLLMRIMHEAGLVQVVRAGTGRRGRPYTIYRMTQKIHKELVVSDILNMMVPD